MSRVRNLVDYQSQTADLDGDATRDLNISGTVTAGAVASANVPDVNLTIAPEVLEIQVDAPDAGQDIMWKWTWEQSTLPYARRTITNSAELNVPLYKEGTYVVNNFAAYDIHGSMTQTHSLYLKWIKSAGTDNLVSWATSAGPISDTHPDINGGTATDVQRITVNVPATITPPTLTNPTVSYTVTNTASGSYTFSGAASGNNPNLGPFYRGGTYTINISATGHPFYFTTDNGTNFSAGTYFGEYTSGVTGSRTDSGTITFTVPAGAPDTLYYQCGNHGVMRGEITVKDLAVETNINGNYVVYFQHTQEGHATPVELRPIPSLVNQMCIVYDAGSGKFVPQDLATYVENTPSFENKIREVAGTAELVVEDGSAVIAKVNVYDDSTYLPLTGNNPGDQAFATDTDILYIWDGSAWQQAGAANSDDLTEGSTNLFFTDARADARIAAATTTDLTEGTNLYYTDARVNTYLSAQGYDTATNIVASITDSAPNTLDTLNELAAALGDDASFSTTITNSIATKLPLAGGTLTGDLQAPGLYVGSTNNSFDFYNNGTTYLNGTTTIDDTLSVVGPSGTDVVQNIRNPSTSWNQYALTRYGSEGQDVRYMDFGYYRGSTEALRGLVIKSQANSSLVTFLDSGKVGIGTPTPENTLHVASSANAQLLVQNTSTGDASIKFNRSGQTFFMGIESSDNSFRISDTGTGVGDGDRLIIDTSGNPTFTSTAHTSLQVRSADLSTVAFMQTVQGTDIRIGGSTNHPVDLYTNGTRKVRIDSSGNVGIGTDSPARSLHVVSSTVGGVAAFEGTNNGVVIQGHSSDANIVEIVGYKQSDSTYADVHIRANTTGLIVKEDSGNVGIGTETPGAKLEVNGGDIQIASTSGITHNRKIIDSVERSGSWMAADEDLNKFSTTNFGTYNSTARGHRVTNANYMYGRMAFPVDATATYRMTTNFTVESGSAVMYAGADSYSQDGGRLATDQANGYNYFVQGMIGQAYSPGTYTRSGYIRGYNATNEGDHYKFDPYAAYWTPVFLWNYSSTASTVVHSIIIERVTALGTISNPFTSVSHAQGWDAPSGLHFFLNSAGEVQELYYDNTDGGWIMVSSNNANSTTIPSGNGRHNLAYTIRRNGTMGALGTASPDNDYLIGGWVDNFSWTRARLIGFGRRSTNGTYSWSNLGTYINCQFNAPGWANVVTLANVSISGTSSVYTQNSGYWTVDGIQADYNNGGFAANPNQTTIGMVGVAASDGDPDSGCYVGHGTSEGHYEGWYDSGGGAADCQGYTTWVR